MYMEAHYGAYTIALRAPIIIYRFYSMMDYFITQEEIILIKF